LEHYNGSVYYIHGLQDWNVDPHMAFDQFDRLKRSEIETKGLFGQWDHAYPDRRSNHEDQQSGFGEEAFPATVRHDWAQDLLEWFDHTSRRRAKSPSCMLRSRTTAGTGASRTPTRPRTRPRRC